MPSSTVVIDIAVVQMKSLEEKQENLEVSLNYIKEASSKKANFIFFPEFQMAFSPSGQSAEQLANKIAEPVNGNFISMLCSAAKKNKIGVVATMYEKSDYAERVYDTAVLINHSGKVISVYRKLHLYDALGFRESDKMARGKSIEKPAMTNAGSIGMMICYDIRFPELSRILTINGAEILAAPSAWVHGVMKEEHWQTMLKARAIENGAYVVAPDQVGNIYSGRSMIIDPFGATLLDMGNREGMEVVEIDLSRVQKTRESLPLLNNRRTDVYSLSTLDGP